MSTWSGGYVTEIAYEWYFFHELAPAHLDFACLLKGYRPPGPSTSFTYLELGAGLGLTSTMLAATNPTGSFWAVDVNPTHVVSAAALADEAGLDNVSFIEAGFDELSQRDLPAFDYIVLHGVWSWVSEATRSIILDVIRTRLKPGGVVYLSYNCAVGWGVVRPLGHLLRMLARLEHGPIETRLRNALERMAELSRQEGGFFDAHPAARAWLERLHTYSFNYLAHEYLTEHWTAFYVDEVLRDMERAKLSFVGAANPLRNFDVYALKEASKRQADAYGDLVLLETLKDLDTAAGLRKDVFVRGGQTWTSEQSFNELKNLRFALVVGPEDLAGADIHTSLGDTAITGDVLEPFVAALRTHPHSLAELADVVVDDPRYAIGDILLVCTVLTDGRYIAPLPRRPVAGARTTSTALNRAIVRRTLDGNPIRFLAAPEIASGLPSGDWERYCYAALDATDDTVALDSGALHQQLQLHVTAALAEKGRVLHDEQGTPLDEQGLSKLAVHFTEQTHGLWKALGII